MALSLKEGKLRNTIIDKSFILFTNNKFKGAKVICKYCQKKLDKNAFQLQDHVNGCKKYQEAAI